MTYSYNHGLYGPSGWSPADYPFVNSNYDYKIRDVFVEATLTETYQARSKGPQEVTYMFQIPPEASVIDFSAQIGDVTVQAVVDETKEADRKYRDATKAGAQAWQLGVVNDELLQIVLGKVSPNSLIKTRVTYVHVISTNTLEDSVRLTIPAGFIFRPGGNPNTSAVAPTAQTGRDPAVTITVGIEVSEDSEIQSLHCISHNATIVPGFSDSSFKTMSPVQRQQARRDWKSYVTFSSNQFLDNHFVLAWTVPLIDQPRCFVERLSDPTIGKPETLAFALTMVSNVELPLDEHEYIFMIDKSASMAGSRIETANRVVKTMLTQLPSHKKSTFNIYTFSISAQSILSGGKSLPYDTAAVAEATSKLNTSIPSGPDQKKDVPSGTDIKAALEAVFKDRDRSKPRCSVIVITDGLDWSMAAALRTVQENVGAAEAESKLLRVFVMGLGDQVSRGMCEGLGRAGAGATAYISEGQLLNDFDNQDIKAETLINAINLAPIRVVSIDWGVIPAAVRPDNSGGFVSSRPPPKKDQLGPADKGDNLPPPLAVQQAPLPGTMFWAFRSSWYAIVSGTIRDCRVRVTYQVRGLAGSTRVLEIPYRSQSSGRRLVHSLAAKALIQTLEDKAQSIKESSSDEKYYNEAEIIRLGKTYRLASKYTTFIATSNGIGTRTSIIGGAPPGARSLLASLPASNSSDTSTAQTQTFAESSPQSRSFTARGFPSPTSATTRSATAVTSPTARSMSALTTGTPTSKGSPGPFDALAVSLAEDYGEVASTPHAVQEPEKPEPESTHETEETPREPDLVPEIVALQDSNGAFDPSAAERLVFAGTAIPAIPASIATLNGSGEVKQQVWVTMCVVAFLQKKHAQRSSDWFVAVSEAQRFVKTILCSVFGIDPNQAEGVFVKFLGDAEAYFE